MYTQQDLGDSQKKQKKLARLAQNLQTRHDKLVNQGPELGDKEFDQVESQLEAVLDEYLKYQIEVDEECQENKTKNPCDELPKCIWLEQKFNWLQFWATKKGYCVSKLKSAILEEQYKESAQQLTDIVDKLKRLQQKKKLTIKNKHDLKYLKHLKKRTFGNCRRRSIYIKRFSGFHGSPRSISKSKSRLQKKIHKIVHLNGTVFINKQ